MNPLILIQLLPLIPSLIESAIKITNAVREAMKDSPEENLKRELDGLSESLKVILAKVQTVRLPE